MSYVKPLDRIVYIAYIQYAHLTECEQIVNKRFCAFRLYIPLLHFYIPRYLYIYSHFVKVDNGVRYFTPIPMKKINSK